MDFDSDSDSTDNIYEVEKILDAKKKDGKAFYKVRWEGYGSEEDSWEPNDNLLTCQELVDRFWLEKKEGYKKRGRKPKRLKEIGGEDSDTDEGNRKDQNDDESEMTTPPEKRRRGRPPKHRVLEKDVGGMEEKSSLDGSSSTSPDLSEGNTAKKKRGRPPKDGDYFSTSLTPSELSFLGLDQIAPLGLTRQASKELALVSLRKKQEHDHIADSNSEIRSAFLDTSSDAKYQKCEPSVGDTSAVCSEQDPFEVIEISSQTTTDDEREYCSQDAEPAVIKECIVISSQSESEGEGQKLQVKSSLDSVKTNLKKKNNKDKSLIQDVRKDLVGEEENSVGKKKKVTKLKKSLSIEKQAKKDNERSPVDAFPPIDFSFESSTRVSQDANDREPFLKSSRNLQGFEIEASKVFDEPGQETDENSNQVTSTRADLSSKLSVSKMQSLRMAMKVNNPLVGGLNNNNKSEQKSSDLLNITDDIATATKSSSKSSPVPLVQGSCAENSVFEGSIIRRQNNEMEKSTTRPSLDETDTSQLCNQGIGTMKRLASEKKNKGKARRTEGRPKSLREFKKRLSIDKTAVLQQSPPSTDFLAGAMSDNQGKTDKYNTTSTTADLLPMQNRMKSVPLMDGDLIGAIIQQSGNDSDSKVKSLSTAPAAKKEGKNEDSGKEQDKAHDEAGNFRSWDSGMEDISDGEDDLSDFEFDLDDYSPHSFFNELEESNEAVRACSPAVEPLNLSWASLRQAIQEGDVMLVRRALTVPGINPDDVAIDTASGMTLLMWAATSGQDEVVRLLLRRGAGVNAVQKTTAMTALLHAAQQGFPETVQILVESGAHINWQQTAGETALMKACKKGHEEVVEVLLKNGVDTKAQSSYEQTAIQIALRNQHFKIQNLLQEHEKSLENTLQVALGKCLGTAGTLRLPLVMPYRCIAPGEKESVTFTLKYNPSKGPQGTKVVLFCVKADFNGDEVCLSFCGDNGVRSVLLNASIQYPLVQGNRSVYLLSLDAEATSNELTVETHPVKSRLIVCAANVSPAADS